MNRRALCAANISSLLFSASAALADEKTYDLRDFDSIAVSAGVTAEINVGPDYSVRAESTAEGLERLEIRLKGSELQIGREHDRFFWRRHEDVTVYVTLPALNALDASSGSQARASGVNAGNFVVDASSGANVDISGRCRSLTIDVSSGADVEAADLECESATADASSGASAEIFASESVIADASSGASIRIYGGPDKVNTDTSSGGGVNLID